MGGAGGIFVASHIVGDQMRRMVDEPEHRAEIDASLEDVYETLFMTSSPTCTKAALNMLGHRVGGLRLPMIEADEPSWLRCATMLVQHNLPITDLPASARRERTARPAPRWTGGDRQNMTVLEYDGRIVVVDVGLAFHAGDGRESTWCCPTSPTCASEHATSRRFRHPRP